MKVIYKITYPNGKIYVGQAGAERAQLCGSRLFLYPPIFRVCRSADAILRPASRSLSPPAPIAAAGGFINDAASKPPEERGGWTAIQTYASAAVRDQV
jgi:hypothetical protein